MKNWMKMEKLLLKNQRYSKMKTRRIIRKLVQKKTTLKSKMKKKRMLKLHKTRLMMHSWKQLKWIGHLNVITKHLRAQFKSFLLLTRLGTENYHLGSLMGASSHTESWQKLSLKFSLSTRILALLKRTSKKVWMTWGKDLLQTKRTNWLAILQELWLSDREHTSQKF